MSEYGRLSVEGCTYRADDELPCAHTCAHVDSAGSSRCREASSAGMSPAVEHDGGYGVAWLASLGDGSLWSS